MVERKYDLLLKKDPFDFGILTVFRLLEPDLSMFYGAVSLEMGWNVVWLLCLFVYCLLLLSDGAIDFLWSAVNSVFIFNCLLIKLGIQYFLGEWHFSLIFQFIFQSHLRCRFTFKLSSWKVFEIVFRKTCSENVGNFLGIICAGDLF